MKKYFYWGLVLIMVAIIVLFKLNKDSKKEAPKVLPTKAMSISITGIKIQDQEFTDLIKTNGNLLSNEMVELKSEISAKIIKLNFREGSSVKKGELLVKMYDADLQATLKKLIYKKQLAESIENRQKILLEKNGTSKEDYEKALNELNLVNADIELIKAQIDKTEIRAPFDGTVGLRYISEGAFITPNSKIANFYSNSQIKIEFAIPQKYVGYAKLNTQINFKLPSSSNTFTAKIYAIEPEIDEMTRTVKIRAIANNSGFGLNSGAYAEVEMSLGSKQRTILIPSETIVPDVKGQKVYLYKSGKAVEQFIELGSRNESQAQVLSGLNIGDTLINSGIILLKKNAPVKIKVLN